MLHSSPRRLPPAERRQRRGPALARGGVWDRHRGDLVLVFRPGDSEGGLNHAAAQVNLQIVTPPGFGCSAGDSPAVSGGSQPDPREGRLHHVWLSEAAAHVPHGAARHDQQGPLPR